MGHFKAVWEVDAIATIGLFAEGGFLVAAQHFDFSRPQACGRLVRTVEVKPICLRHRAFLFVQEENGIHLVVLLREAELAVSEGIDGSCAVDGFAVHLHPLADFLHAEQGRVGQVAVGIGAHVEEEVAAFGHHIAEQMD